MTKKKKAVPKPRRLIRYLVAGDRVVVKGVRGKPVSAVRAGRRYVLEVRNKGKLKGFVNNVDGKGSPVPKAFTTSMLNRLKHTRKKLLEGEQREVSHTFKITNKKRVKLQIPLRVIRTIQKTKGKAFGFRIEFEKTRLLTPFIYTDGKLKQDYLENSITSSILMTLNSNRYRISPVLEGQPDLKRVTRLQEAKVTLEFIDVSGVTGFKKSKKQKTIHYRRGKKTACGLSGKTLATSREWAFVDCGKCLKKKR